LATGDTPYVPETNNPWGFGALPNVYTLSQLERLSSNHGPTGGRVVRADGKAPRRVAVLHCVGRQELGYCSNVCCRAALKTSMLLQHEASDGEPTEVIHLYADLVVGSLLGSSLKERALKRGARLVQIQDVNRVKVTQDAPGMRVLFADGGGEDQELQVDMVILAAGCGPSKGTRELIEKLDITPDGSGFAAPDHPLLRSVESSIEGIFLAGCVSGPRSIAESVASAQAAAGAAMARVQPGKRLTVEVLTAHADESLCSKCLVCVSVCPYRACVYDEKEDRVHVNELLCHGCGTCVAACASGAASARHFSDRQLEAEIEEVLHG
jgi:heterodisulfide reductase subunit A